MKPRSSQYGGPSSRLLTVNSLVLLLVCFLSEVQSKDTKQAFELNNWVQISEGVWPPEDTKNKNPFLVYHNEFVTGKLFNLNKKIFDGVDHITDPSLSFRYWSSSETTKLRSQVNGRNPTRDIKLLGSAGWQNSPDALSKPVKDNVETHLNAISSSDWENFGFSNDDIFTLALKDVEVNFVERIDTEKTSDEVTGYNNNEKTLNNFKLEPAPVVAPPAQKDGTFKIEGDKIIFKTTTAGIKAEGVKKIELKFENDGKTEAVTLTVDAANKIAADKLLDVFKTTAPAVNAIKELKIAVTKAGFTISEVKFDGTSKTAADLKALITGLQEDVPPVIKDEKTYSLQKLSTDQVKGYIQLDATSPSEEANKNKDICFTIEKIGAPDSIVDVFVALKNARFGIKLDTLASGKLIKEVCVLDYLALQNIGTIQLTLVVEGDFSDLAKLKVTTEPKPSKFTLAPLGKLASGAWYINSPAVDYSITSTDTFESVASLLVCDVVANCYPFDIKEESGKKVLSIGDKIKAELAQSPFIRISGQVNDKTSFTTNVDEKAKKDFNEKFVNDNQNSLSEDTVKAAKKEIDDKKVPSLKYEAKFDATSKKAKIAIPLENIDLRVHQLITSINLVEAGDEKKVNADPNNFISLTKIGYKKSGDRGSFEFPSSDFDIFSPFSVKFSDFTLGSDQFFVTEESQLGTGNSAWFELELNLAKANTHKVLINFEVKQIAKKVIANLAITEKDDLKDHLTIHPSISKDNQAKRQIPLKSKSTSVLATHWIQSAYDQKLGNTDLQATFTVTAGSEINPSNIAIYRVIIDQDLNPKFKSVGAGKPLGDKKTVTFTDNIKDEGNDKGTALNGDFRIGYILHSSEKFETTVTITNLSVKGAVAEPNNCKKESSIASTNCKYVKLACPATFNDADSSCDLKKLNRQTVKKCNFDQGCSNIFDRQLPVSKLVANKKDTTEYAPFQIDVSKEASEKQYNLTVNRPETNTKGDFCLEFIYGGVESGLTVSSRHDGRGLNFPLTPANNPYQDGRVCASWLTNDPGSVQKFYFVYHKKPLYAIDDHLLEIIDPANSIKLASEKWALEQGIFINNLNLNQFSIDYKEDNEDTSSKKRWTASSTELSNKLVYTIEASELPSLDANAKIVDKEVHISTLRSKWIKAPNKDEHLKIGFTYNSTTSNLQNLAQITVIVHSQSETLFSEDVSTVSPTEVKVVDKLSADGWYQILIKVQIDMAKLAEAIAKDTASTDGKDDVKDLVLTFDDFSVNDPCVRKNNKLDKCSSTLKNSVGKCVRSYLETNYTGACYCTNKDFFGDHCELQDYCNKGKGICKAKACKNDYEFNQVKCDCEKDVEVWSPFLLKCINFKALECGENRALDSNSKCLCIEGFIEDPSKNKTCVKFEPCIDAHRVLAKLPKPCQDPNARCDPSETQATGVECTCNPNYFNLHGEKTKYSKCLPDACKDCEDRCEASGKEYKCVEKKCSAANGYVMNVNKTCEIDVQFFKNLWGCDPEIKKDDHKPGCKCSKGQKFDPITRLCPNECSEELVKECASRQASGCIFDAVNKKPVCQCKESDIPYSAKNDSNSWTCMSRCDVLALPEQHENRCSGSFQYCDNNKDVWFDPKKDYQTDHGLEKADLIENVFVYSKTLLKIVPQNKPYCKCEVGFEQDGSDKCVPSEIPTHTIQGMEFDLKPTKNEAGYIKQVEVAFATLVGWILSRDNTEQVKPHDTKCVKKSDTTLSCSTSFQTLKNDTQIIDLLKKACVHVGTKCIYLPEKYVPTANLGRRRRDIGTQGQIPPAGANVIVYNEVLVHDRATEPTSAEMDYCAKPKICAKYPYSSCHNDKTKPFECLCDNLKHFTVSDTELVGVQNSKVKLNMQSCQLKNLCEVEKDNFGCAADAQCHHNVELVEKVYVPTSYCTCKNVTLAHRNLSCKKTCDAKCSGNIEGCAHDYLTDSVVCHCKEGFSGETCSLKSDAAKESKAYLIATIVVSVIAVIALIGLAVLYFKRR